MDFLTRDREYLIDFVNGQIFVWPFFYLSHLYLLLSQNFLACSGGAKDQKILIETKGDRDDLPNSP